MGCASCLSLSLHQFNVPNGQRNEVSKSQACRASMCQIIGNDYMVVSATNLIVELLPFVLWRPVSNFDGHFLPSREPPVVNGSESSFPEFSLEVRSGISDVGESVSLSSTSGGNSCGSTIEKNREFMQNMMCMIIAEVCKKWGSAKTKVQE